MKGLLFTVVVTLLGGTSAGGFHHNISMSSVQHIGIKVRPKLYKCAYSEVSQLDPAYLLYDVWGLKEGAGSGCSDECIFEMTAALANCGIACVFSPTSCAECCVDVMGDVFFECCGCVGLCV